MGYRPRWEIPDRGQASRGDWWFDPGRGGLFVLGEVAADQFGEESHRLRKPTRVTPEEVETIHRFRLSKFEEIDEGEPERATAKKWVPLLGDYVEYHLETRPQEFGFWREIQTKG